MESCRVCGGALREFLDFGQQPLSDAFRAPGDIGDEFHFQLSAGSCTDCTMVQLLTEAPRERMFNQDYPYHSSGSAVMTEHFTQTAETLRKSALTGRDPFMVEVGCNDGIMLRAIERAGIRHLGVDPSASVTDVARAKGLRVRTDFFEEATARRILADEGPADLIYSANTISHVAYIESIFRGFDTVLTEDGLVVFEDPYLGDIIERTSFDQFIDEHFFFFTVRSVQAMAERYGFQLVDVERLEVHGGQVRYTIARSGRREPGDSVREMLLAEQQQGLADPGTLEKFGRAVERVRKDLLALLQNLRAEGRRVVGYGATAKSATALNYCGIGPDLVSFVCDSTPAKQGRLTPGSHIPVRPPEDLAGAYPDYILLLAWNHAEEIMAKEQAFQAAGGHWILYVPEVHIR